MLLALVAQYKWKFFQMYVRSTFLNSYVDDKIYVEHPEGFEVRGIYDCVYKLNKSLYGLKQAPRAWYSKITPFPPRVTTLD
jgi:hypothetical protein